MESAITPSAIPTQTPAICSRVRGRLAASGTAACESDGCGGVETTYEVQVEVTVDGGDAVLSRVLSRVLASVVDDGRLVELVIWLSVGRALEPVVERADVVVEFSLSVRTGTLALTEGRRPVVLDGAGAVAVAVRTE